MRIATVAALVVGVAACGDDGAWLIDPHVLVDGVHETGDQCRTGLCPHDENTDLTIFDGAIYLVHRTAMSQVLGPNSSLRVSRTTDGGAHFQLLAIIPAPVDRDLRDPHFDVVGGQLAIKALTRLPVNSTRDSDVHTVTISTVSSDGGTTWGPLAPIAPETWSFWRIRVHDGVHYSAAYQDGDQSVRLFTSPDGATWSQGALIYGVAEDTPLETELVFMPSGRLLALVRVDGTDAELLGNQGRLRTVVCWALPPYDAFDCPQELTDQRLDGPVAFWHGARLFVIAREHYLGLADQKRTALFELGGTLEGGPLTIALKGELPSAGDTAYAGVADVDDDHALVTWYSSNIADDDPWVRAIFLASDIWQATIDFREL